MNFDYFDKEECDYCGREGSYEVEDEHFVCKECLRK